MEKYEFDFRYRNAIHTHIHVYKYILVYYACDIYMSAIFTALDHPFTIDLAVRHKSDEIAYYYAFATVI